jgi:hypothetical protein
VREYQVRLTIRTNEGDPDGDTPYYGDQEMPREIRRWFDHVLADVDDGPRIIWSEFTLRTEAGT